MIEPAIGVNPVMPGWPGFVSAYPYGMLSLNTAPVLEPLSVADVKAHLRLDSSNSEPAPTAPTVALVTAAGSLTSGVHRWAWVARTADGATELGGVSAALTTDTATHGQATVTKPVEGTAVTYMDLYRTAASGSLYLFVAATANDGATYTDNIADSALGAQAPTVNTTQDPAMTEIIVMSREWAERDTERAFLTQVWTLYLDSFPWWRAPILLPKPPAQNVLSIKYYDSDNVQQTWGTDQYIIVQPAGPTAQRAQVVPAAGVSWPLLPSFALTQRRPDAVQVKFTCGWATVGEVPRAIRAAMKLMAGNIYRNREAGQITRGSADVLPFGCDALLAPYRVCVY